MSPPRPRPRPSAASAAILALLVALLAAGCGGGEDAPARAVTVPEVVASQRDGDDSEDGDDAPVPTPAAIAQGARLDALVAAYAPVSARVNFLVTAETLRLDAVESAAGVEVELERAGSVRVEVNRMRRILRNTRPRVAAARLTSDVQRRVQRHMLDAIDARVRSLAQLDAALDGRAATLPDRIVEARFAAWRESWDASLRAARTATTVMQGARAARGLAPAAEESIR